MWISKKADFLGRPQKTTPELRYWISKAARWKVMWILEIFDIWDIEYQRKVMWIFAIFEIFDIWYLRYWISKVTRWKVMWIFEKVNAVGVLGQIPLLGEITSRISNYARDIHYFTQQIYNHFERYSVFLQKYILSYWEIFTVTNIYIIILRDIRCFTKMSIVIF